MRKEIRAEINRANAMNNESVRPYPRNTERARSTSGQGPKSIEGRAHSAMNAFKHGLTGQSLILQEDETEAYNRLTAALLSDLKPKTEIERQIVQKIIDTHFRLNRLACVENNIFNFGLIDNTATTNDVCVEAMIAQTRAWIGQSHSFDVLGRYEARLTRQVLQFTRELERLQKDRIASQPIEKKKPAGDLASFGKPAPEHVMRANSSPVLARIPWVPQAPDLSPPC